VFSAYYRNCLNSGRFASKNQPIGSFTADAIRHCPVDGIRIAGRSTQGVIVFSTGEGEKVASVERLTEEGGEENGGE
jgi:hypothetical protein